VLTGIVTDAERVADHQGGDLDVQLLFGVADAAERMREIPIQPGGMSRMMPAMPISA
jgi:hypothetical protein